MNLTTFPFTFPSLRSAAPVLALAATFALAGPVSAEAGPTAPASPTGPGVQQQLEQAADLRPDHDPVKVDDLREASRLHYVAGRAAQVARAERAAHDAGAEAARVALRPGDLMEAVGDSIDAAWILGRISLSRASCQGHPAGASPSGVHTRPVAILIALALTLLVW